MKTNESALSEILKPAVIVGALGGIALALAKL